MTETAYKPNSDTESEEFLFKYKKKSTSSLKNSLVSTTSSSNEELPSVKDALNEYFKLKQIFEDGIAVHKKEIINNEQLSKREKRTAYLKFTPKCVNCKRPSKNGTLFSTTYHPSDDKMEEHRTFRAVCGNLADPCNLNIEIILGKAETIQDIVNDLRNEIIRYKNKIIDDKNKLLFGLITTETALNNFDINKSAINDITSLYETYLDELNNITDNQETKIELNEAITISYENINSIKKCIQQMNETNDSQYAVDAVEIYHTTLKPLLDKIRLLKYRENYVFNNEKNICVLIQKKLTINDNTPPSHFDKVVAYDVGFVPQQTNLSKMIKKTKIAGGGGADEWEERNEGDEGNEGDEEYKEGKFKIQIKQPGTNETKPYSYVFKEIPRDEPNIGQGKDGISWNVEEYQILWNKLPEKLKSEFKLNIEWMKQFMNNCIDNKNRENMINPLAKKSEYKCEMVTPPNLVIPPRQMDNGKYDFGVSIYNRIFNNLPISLQQSSLTLYKEDPMTKAKDYTMLEDTLNRYIAKEVDFDRGFF